MNGYDLSRAWFNFRYGKKNEVKAIHSELYLFIVDLWNRLGQPREFGLPTDASINALGLGSYSTYKKALDGLIEFGFIEEVCPAKNQFQSRIIALSKIDKAIGKTLDKALINATAETLVETVGTINKQQTINNKQSLGDGKSPIEITTKYWKVLVDVWFDYYKIKFETEPTFDGASAKSLKSILTKMERLSKKKKTEWTEDLAKRSLTKFLNNAWADNWMRENFLLKVMSSKYDAIINKKEITNGNAKPAFTKNR